MLAPFDAPRLKLRRARYHIGDLQQQINAYLSRIPFYLEIAEGFEPGKKRWIVRVRQEVPPDFAAIIGDVIHNLRTALDWLACDLVRLNGKSANNVYFPFAENAVELEKMIVKKNFDRAAPEAIDLLRKLAPHKGADGNEPLRAIHDLDVIDKHQALIPTSDMVGAPGVPGYEGTGIRIGPIRDGMSVTTLPAQDHLAVGFTIDGQFTLYFPAIYEHATGTRRAPLAGGEIVPTLISLAKHVDGIIEAFAAL